MKKSSFKNFMELNHLDISRDRKKHVLDKYLLSAQSLHKFMCEGTKIASDVISIEQFNAYTDRVVFQYKPATAGSLTRFLKYWVRQLYLAKPERITANIFEEQQTLEILTSYDRLQEVVFDVLLKQDKLTRR